jgi:hypothetical protein
MAADTWTLAFRPLPPRPNEPPVDVRIALLLKDALNKPCYRLRCIWLGGDDTDGYARGYSAGWQAATQLDGPQAWAGWIRQGACWTKKCAAATPALVLMWLSLIPAEKGQVRLVLPAGVDPS